MMFGALGSFLSARSQAQAAQAYYRICEAQQEQREVPERRRKVMVLLQRVGPDSAITACAGSIARLHVVK